MARIDVHGLGKSYGALRAVEDLTFSALPGRVTGLLGPNGSGKSTTMRLMLGLAHGDGVTYYDGRPHASLRSPARRVGALLDADASHPGRSARNHLRMVAAGLGLPTQRCDEVLTLVGLDRASTRRAGTFSTGMRQRLGLATALLGRPDTLILDEPANGLDPEGAAWLRQFLRGYADQGNTLLLSSHVLSGLQELVDDVVVIRGGRLLAHTSLADFLHAQGGGRVVVRADDTRRFGDVLSEHATAVMFDGTRIQVRGLAPERVGALAHEHGVTLHELYSTSASLEQAYLSVAAQDASPAAGPAPTPAATATAQVTA